MLLFNTVKSNTQPLLILCPFSNYLISLNFLSLSYTLFFTINANSYWLTTELRKNKWKNRINKIVKKNCKWGIVKRKVSRKVNRKDRVVVRDKERLNKNVNRNLLLEVSKQNSIKWFLIFQ